MEEFIPVMIVAFIGYLIGGGLGEWFYSVWNPWCWFGAMVFFAAGVGVDSDFDIDD